MAPNCERIVAALAADYPQEFKDCHRPQTGARAWDFIRRVAWVLHTTVDQRFGLNGKRGNTGDPSMDAVSFRTPGGGAGGVEIIDVVARAGASDAKPMWLDVTKATLNAGTIGAFIQPEPVQAPPPVVTPPPGGVTPPPVSCVCADEIAGLYESLANLIVKVESLADRNESLHASAVYDRDDIKRRIERVSQELANKPVTECKRRWF